MGRSLDNLLPSRLTFTRDDVRQRWPLYVAALGLPLTYWLLKPSRKKEDFPTDFNSYLRAPVAEAQARPAPLATSFEAFLKEQPKQVYAETDFQSFLKKQAAPAGKAATGQQAAGSKKPAEKRLVLTADLIKVTVMFGTEYGFSRDIAEKLCERIKGLGGYFPELVNMADVPEGYDFSREQAVFMACSTQGDGVPPTEAREFCEWLFGGKAGILQHLHFAVIALGDSSYEHFCRCGKQLDAAMEKSGAKRLLARPDVNKEDWPVVNAWIDALVAALPGLKLKNAGEMGLLAAGAADAGAKKAAVKRWGKSRPYYANVVALEGLCTLTSADDKDTHRVEFDLGDSGLAYAPGDALGIYPSNVPAAVEELLTVIGQAGTTPVPVPSWHYEESAELTAAYPAGAMPLAAALTRAYDLRSPKADILNAIWAAAPQAVKAKLSAAPGHKAHDSAESLPTVADGAAGKAPAGAAAQAALLRSLVEGEQSSRDKYFEQRHLVDILTDFSEFKLPLTTLLSHLRQLQPRLYSISSSPLERDAAVQASIAVVRYSCLGKERVGVCSTFVGERLELGNKVPVYIHKNPDFRLPADPAVPIIMVGPGTGLAPFRSFILHRHLESKKTGAKPGEMVLYFGCRRSDQDYLYGKDLEAWAKEGIITLHTAFSRMQAQKVYVQNRLAESGPAVWKLLEAGAHFYVCGDASSMAGQVEEALLAIIAQHSGKGVAGAAAYLDALKAQERYQRDVWF